MSDVYIFRRVEKKYIIGGEQKRKLIELIGRYLTPDLHGVSTICSLYLDTPDYRLIRNSIDAVSYKEKLRIRSYGIPDSDSRVFFEIKKKFEGVVYKRRVAMSCADAIKYTHDGVLPAEGQIMNEIDWLMHFYGMPLPRIAILYEREAYDVEGHQGLRITFDRSVRYRDHDLLSKSDSSDVPILAADRSVFEVKTEAAMPMWLSAALEKCSIYPASFSKYGTAYIDMLNENKAKGENNYA